MRLTPFKFVVVLAGIACFALACRTADLIANVAEPTATLPRATRAAQRATFTPIPTSTEVPAPTDTPEPTATAEPTEPPPPTARPATRRPPPPPPPTQAPPTARPPTAVPSPTVYYLWTASGQSCVGGTDSSVSGKITANGTAAVGQFVQASSGPGGEPISEVPAQSDKNGNYKVSFICGGGACNGDFWVWMVDAQRRQLSPFVKFSFNGGCRLGTLNFNKR